MKIAVDCRYLGKSGIGRVCRGILDALDYEENEYYLIGKEDALAGYPKAHIVIDETEPYSAAGIFSFPKRLNKLCDALLIPNFLIPFGVKIPVHTVMHDLAFLDVRETTRGVFDCLVKKTLLKRCMKKSKTVSCVSAFTLSRCEHYYKKRAKKCYLNYNGISESVFEYARKHPSKERKENCVVFVGNVKPHKGLKTLLSAFSELGGDAVLKIIGEKENFLTGVSLDGNVSRNVVFTGAMGDEKLFAEIRRAKYLALPSKYEGFGLPPLEALALGTQPIVSDIPVFREVYEGFPVVFFADEKDLGEKLQKPPAEIDCAEQVAERYNFRAMAKKLVAHVTTPETER